MSDASCDKSAKRYTLSKVPKVDDLCSLGKEHKTSGIP